METDLIIIDLRDILFPLFSGLKGVGNPLE